MLDRIHQIITSLKDPHTGEILVAAGQIKSLNFIEGTLSYLWEIAPSQHSQASKWQELLDTQLKAIPEVKHIKGIVTASRALPPSSSSRPFFSSLEKVKKIIAVSSAKGGVGKSTTAVNLAIALSQQGLRIGLLDADIYGPSVPTLLGITQRPALNSDKKITPLEKYDLKCISIGLMIQEDQALIWRGPMAQGAVLQLFKDVAWGELDILIIDMPPGTGDIALTIAKNLQLQGAVIVSTPQDLALIDAKKSIAMFRKLNVPILGLVENMSFFICPHCAQVSDIFGHGNTRKEAEKLGLPSLGEIPLHIEIRKRSDEGHPITLEKESPIAQSYQEAAKRLISCLKELSS